MIAISKIKTYNKTPGYEPALLHLWSQHPSPYTTARSFTYRGEGTIRNLNYKKLCLFWAIFCVFSH